MDSRQFDELFRDEPRLTAEEITAFLAAWTVVGAHGAPEMREAPPAAKTADELIAILAAGLTVDSPEPERTNLDELVAILAAGLTVDSPEPERTNLRRGLSARIAQRRESALAARIAQPTQNSSH
jgi:hypothetical protein